jgi:predicted metal-dependent phosphoesterase TrpH
MHRLDTCDLHTHTLHSDGELTPEALVELAASRGLAALAITDHDVLDAIPAATRRGAALGVEIVPGIELSVDEDGRDVHLLGYFVSRPELLHTALTELQAERRRRAARMVERLADLGCAIDYDAVLVRARGGVVGRPHVAEELLAHGHVDSINDAFDRYLATDRPAYFAKRTLGLADAARLLRSAGAVPAVAHPGASDLGPLLPHLRAAGVLGLEVWHPKHTATQVRRYLRIAQHYDLLPTGGSDFHRLLPGGILPGDVPVKLEVLEALRARAA